MKQFRIYLSVVGALVGILFFTSACSRNDTTTQQRGENPQNAERGGAESTGGFMTGSTSQPNSRGPEMTFHKAPVTDITEILGTSTPERYWTRAIELRGVAVQHVFSGGQYMLVGPDADHTLLVQLQEVRPQLKPGDTLDIAGIINPLSSDLSQWNINPADQERLKGFNTFVIETRSQPGRK